MSVSDALARADKNLKKDILWISFSAVGMFLGSPTDIQRIGPMSEIDIFWTSTGLTCVMWPSSQVFRFGFGINHQHRISGGKVALRTFPLFSFNEPGDELAHPTIPKMI